MMIVRKLSANLKEQHWTTIGIELIIVIIGVFVGTQVSSTTWTSAREVGRASVAGRSVPTSKVRDNPQISYRFLRRTRNDG